MRTALIVLAVLVLLGVGGFFALAVQSRGGEPQGLREGRLAPCPPSPNCVCSEDHADGESAVAPLPAAAWPRLAEAVEETGGRIVTRTDGYIAAEYRSALFGFVDDVEFRRTEDAIHVRSASRVGHSDMGANAKRVAAIRSRL